MSEDREENEQVGRWRFRVYGGDGKFHHELMVTVTAADVNKKGVEVLRSA